MTLSNIIQNLKKLPEYGKQLVAAAKSKEEAEKANEMLAKVTKTTSATSSNISADLGTNIKNIFQPVTEPSKPPLSAKTPTITPISDLSPFEKVAQQLETTQKTQTALGEAFRAKPISEQWKEVGDIASKTAYTFVTLVPNMVYELGASAYDAYKNDIVAALSNKDVESITKVKQLNPILGFITGNPEGKFQTIQGRALSRIGQGENPYLSLAKATGETIMDGLVTMGMANKVSTELAKYYPNEAKMKAWVELGMPANSNELKQNFNNLAFQYHPDRPGGDEGIFKSIANSYDLLQKEGLPSTNQLTQFLGKIGKTLTTPVKNLDKIQDIWTKMPSAGAGETAVPKLQLPGYAAVGEPQPTIGLQTQPIEPVGKEKVEKMLPQPEDMLALPRGIKIPKTARALKQQYNLAAAQGDWEKAEKLAKEWINVLPSSKKKFKMYERSEDWDEIMRPMLSSLPNNVRQAIKVVGKNIGTSGISSLRSMGEAGNKLADKLETVEALSSIQSGNMKADMKYKTNISKMNDDELKSVTALAEGRPPIVDNENVRQVFDMWNQHHSIISNIAQNMQVSIVTKDGDIFQFVPKENYFPHFIRTNELLTNPKYLKEVIDYQVKTGGFKSYEEAEQYAQNFLSYIKTNGEDNRFLNSYAKDNNMSLAEANFILRRYIFPTSVRKYGNLERAREINLKLYDPNPSRVLESFYDNVWRRLYEIQEFGQNNDIAFDLITKIGQNNYDWELAQRIFDVSMNKVSFNKSMEKAMSIFTDVETVKLITSQILQITQQSNIVALTGYKNWIKGFKKAFSQAGKEEALRAGAMFEKSLYEAMSGVAKHGFGEEYLKKIGFTVADNFNRIVAVNCAKETIDYLIKNPTGSNYYLLKKLLITPDRVNKLIARGSLTEEDLRIAQFRLSKITQFTVRPEDLPPEWKDNLMVKSMVLYKSFAFQQAKFIKDFIFKNPKWLLRFIPVAIITAELANDIKSFIKGKKRPTKLLERTIEDLVTVGTFGLITDIFESANYAGGIARYIVGPIWGDAAEITEGISSLITKRKIKPIAKKTFEYLPYMFPPSVAPYVGIASQPLKGVIFPPKKTTPSTDTSIIDLGGGGGNSSILDLDLIK